MTSPDTLCLPLPQSTPLCCPMPFGDSGFFAGDTLLHAEVGHGTYGFCADAAPYRLRRDGWSGLLFFLCLLLAACLVLRLRRRMGGLMRSVFFPIPGKKDEPVADDPLRYSTRLLAVCLLSLAAAAVTFTYTQHDIGFYPFPEMPRLLFGIFFLLWTAYFLVKRMMTNFVNWIFFRREKIFTWSRVCTFLYVAEALLFFVLALIVIYQHVSPDEVLLLSSCLVFLVKMLLLFKTYQIFFSKMYGSLHLFVYFCTLEVMPLLVIQRVLTSAALLSTVRI